MKTLRVVRNIAALFILGMALLGSRPGVGVAHAAGGKSCGYKKGFSGCYIDTSGNCQEGGHCRNKVGFCPDQGCV